MGNQNTCSFCFRDEKLYGNKHTDPQRPVQKGAETMYNSRNSSNGTHDSSQNRVLNGLFQVDEEQDMDQEQINDHVKASMNLYTQISMLKEFKKQKKTTVKPITKKNLHPMPAVIMEDPQDQISPFNKRRKSGMIIDDLDDDLAEVLQQQNEYLQKSFSRTQNMSNNAPISARRSRQMRKSGNVLNTTIGTINSYVEKNSNGIRVIDDFSDNDSELIKINDSSHNSFRRRFSNSSNRLSQSYNSVDQSSIGGIQVIRNGNIYTGSDTSSYIGMQPNIGTKTGKSSFGQQARNYYPVIVDDMSSFDHDKIAPEYIEQQDPLVFNSFQSLGEQYTNIIGQEQMSAKHRKQIIIEKFDSYNSQNMENSQVTSKNVSVDMNNQARNVKGGISENGP